MKTRRHKCSEEAPASILQVRSDFKTMPQNGCGTCVPAESVFTCHSVKHDFLLTSDDCSSSVTSPTLDSKFPFGHVERETITVHVLAPFAEDLHKQLNETSQIPVS